MSGYSSNKARWGGGPAGKSRTRNLPAPKHLDNQEAWDRLKERYESANNENYERTLSKAIKSLAASKTPVTTYQEAMALVGVGKHCARIICPPQEGEEAASVVTKPAGKTKKKKVPASESSSSSSSSIAASDFTSATTTTASTKKRSATTESGPSAKELKYQTARQNAIAKWSHPIGSSSSTSSSSSSHGLFWKVLLLIDAREPKHEHIVSKCSMSGIPAESRHLPIGDMTWIAQGLRKHKVCGETTLTVEVEVLLGTLIERKTTEDLVKSLFDSRYMEQRLRLKHSGQPQVLFLIEGDIQKDDLTD